VAKTASPDCVKCGQPRKLRPNGRYDGGCDMCGLCYHAACRAGNGPPGGGRQPAPIVCGDCGGPPGRDAAKGRCGRCYQAWRRAGRPETLPPPRVLRSGWYGYSPARGTARLELAS
jgi:hypothetical protein